MFQENDFVRIWTYNRQRMGPFIENTKNGTVAVFVL